jgi:hypothetical protein
MLTIKQWSLMLALVYIAPLAAAEDGAMSKQEQCSEYGAYQDSSENWVDCVEQASTQPSYSEDTYVEEPYVEEPYVEESYIEDNYVEDKYIEENQTEDTY